MCSSDAMNEWRCVCLEDPLCARVDQNDRQVSRSRQPVTMFACVLDVSRRIRDDELPLRRRESSDRPTSMVIPLFALSSQARPSAKRDQPRSVRGFSLNFLEGLELVFKDRLGIVKQPPRSACSLPSSNRSGPW